MTEPTRHTVLSGAVKLHALTLGEQRNPPVVLLHGMRDVGLSLLPIAAELAEDYYVVLPDLRGHGRSNKPGSYAMPEFIFDLHRVLEDLTHAPPAIVGHSLGGHITSRFSALYPDRVRAAVIVEGLGPPERPSLGEPAQSLAMEAQRIMATLGTASPRPLPDVEFAAERLLANNPRLDPGYALTLARQATELDSQGNLLWAFDPRVGAVFLSAGEGDSARYWAGVKCPTLIVTGAHASEYWAQAIPAGMQWNGAFAPGELEQRFALFADHEHVEFDASGHMVHFDEPHRLAATTREFLRRRP